MDVVSNTKKVPGNKKPLSSSTTEVAKPKGAVLQAIVVKYHLLSNLVRAKRLLKLASSRHSRINITITPNYNS
jgi:hypothetical protein